MIEKESSLTKYYRIRSMLAIFKKFLSLSFENCAISKYQPLNFIIKRKASSNRSNNAATIFQQNLFKSSHRRFICIVKFTDTVLWEFWPPILEKRYFNNRSHVAHYGSATDWTECTTEVDLGFPQFPHLVLPTRMVPRFFVTDDYFWKWKWVVLSLKMTDQPCHRHFYFSQVITHQHNFRASHQGLVPIFYNYLTTIIDNEEIVSILVISCAIGTS